MSASSSLLPTRGIGFGFHANPKSTCAMHHALSFHGLFPTHVKPNKRKGQPGEGIHVLFARSSSTSDAGGACGLELKHIRGCPLVCRHRMGQFARCVERSALAVCGSCLRGPNQAQKRASLLCLCARISQAVPQHAGPYLAAPALPSLFSPFPVGEASLGMHFLADILGARRASLSE